MDEANLFKQYVEICNQAILLNKDRFPFKHILETDRELNSIDVCIIDNNPEAHFIISMSGNGVNLTSHKDHCENCGCTNQKWRVSKAYLEKVVNNPGEYINNPALIDWDWMY